MRSQQAINRSTRNCGRFFVIFAVIDFAIACIHFHLGRWGVTLLLLPGFFFSGFLGWMAIVGANRNLFFLNKPGPDFGNTGHSTARKPVPIKPFPIHHLVAAKDLPPGDKTHSYPKD